MKSLFKLSITLIVAWLSYRWILFPWLMHWGATKEEYQSARPGDAFVQEIWYKNTLVVTVNAPPSKVWPWINQMGLDKGGFYTYTWLENLLGCDLQNADQIHPEWQHTRPGDYEPVCRSARQRGLPGWEVAIVEAPNAFVWRGAHNAQWMLGLYVDSLDSHHSRLITRMQFTEPTNSFSWWMEKLWWNWAHSLMA